MLKVPRTVIKLSHRTGTALAVVALLYFITRHYYDLNLTLLTKSLVMMISGVLFLTAYLILRKKLRRWATRPGRFAKKN